MDLLRESRPELTAATLTRRHNVSLAVLKQFCGKSVPDIPSDTHTKTQGAEIQTIKPQFSSTRETLSFFAIGAESVGARLVLEGSSIGSPLCPRNSVPPGLVQYSGNRLKSSPVWAKIPERSKLDERKSHPQRRRERIGESSVTRVAHFTPPAWILHTDLSCIPTPRKPI